MCLFISVWGIYVAIKDYKKNVLQCLALSSLSMVVLVSSLLGIFVESFFEIYDWINSIPCGFLFIFLSYRKEWNRPWDSFGYTDFLKGYIVGFAQIIMGIVNLYTYIKYIL